MVVGRSHAGCRVASLGRWLFGLALLGATEGCGSDPAAESSEAASVSTAAPLVWTQSNRLVATDGAASDAFGSTVAMDGTTVVVGAASEDGAGSDRGAAYVYYRDQGGPESWGELRKLTPSDGADADFFGSAVAVAADTVLVGAPRDNVGAVIDQGSAYIFYRDQDGMDAWGQVAKLVASDAAANDWFGTAVALSGNTAVVGAMLDDDAVLNRGAAYVFYRDQGGTDAWGQVAKLTASDGAAEERFGNSVAVHGDTAIVGAYTEDDTVNDRGAAYVFYRNQGGADSWGQVTKLTAPSSVAFDFFGGSVALSGDTAVVGAYGRDNPYPGAGAAFVFYRDQGGADVWGLAATLLAGDPNSFDELGFAVAIDVDTVLVGSHLEDDTGSDRGAAYIFGRDVGGGNQWGQVTKLMASDAQNTDQLGQSVALAGGAAVVGANGADADQGAAYVMALKGEPGDSCGTPADCASGFCVDSLCCDDACMGLCQACSTAKKGTGVDGSCGPIGSGTDPDDECGAGDQQSCDGAGQCRAALGGPCSSPTECLSSMCIDSVCCDTACAGVCEACTAAKKGAGSDGSCGPISSGTDPDGECDAGEEQSCNGAGECRKHLGVSCTSASECFGNACVDSVCCDVACDAGCMACSLGKTGVASGTCAFVPLGQDPDDECGDGPAQSCDGAGSCRRELGGPCATMDECLSGYCVDAVCCEERCDSTCFACAAAKSGGLVDGECGPVTAGTDPDEDCPQDANYPASCGPDGLCDGSGSCRTRALSTVECAPASCALDYAVAASHCDDEGACVAPEGVDCAPYACADGACATLCVSDDDCVSPHRCNAESQCAAETECDGDHTVTRPGETALDCSPYRCTPAATCRTTCESTADCVAGYLCTADRRCELPPPAEDAESGCGCRLGGARSSGPTTNWLVALALGASGLRRRLARFRRLSWRTGSHWLATLGATAGLAAVGSCSDEQPLGSLAGEYRVAARVDALFAADAHRLVASDPTVGAFFGADVAVSGDTALVGANRQADPTGAPGTAYVFERDRGGPANWGQVKMLAADLPADEDYFATAVALSGDTAIVGQSGPADSYQGTAYVFYRDQGGPDQWGLAKMLTASDADSGDSFADAVALEGDVALVGAPTEDGAGTDRGAAYVFGRHEGGLDNWGEMRKLTASDAADGDELGTSVAIAGDTAVIGARYSAGAGVNRGAAYVFQRNHGGPDQWGQVTRLSPSAAEDNAWFGWTVALHGDVAVVGAPYLDGASFDEGAAFVFYRDQGGPDSWGQVRKVTPIDPLEADEFGYAVALEGDTLVVGAREKDTDDSLYVQVGAAYVFRRDAGGPDAWGQVDRLMMPEPKDFARLGSAVAISGGWLLGGASNEGGPANELSSGAAYLFTSLAVPGAGCVTPQECRTGLCADGVCCDESCEETCRACAAAKTGGTDGVCAPISANSDPDDECGVGGAESCDGAGACKKSLGQGCVGDAECLSGQCVDLVCCADSCDAVCRACSAVKTGGVDGTCGLIMADTNPNAECGAGDAARCDGAGACKKTLGQGCAQPSECLSNHCVDSRCCDTACDGACLACSAQMTGAAAGTCAPITAGTDPSNECGAGGEESCDGAGACRKSTGGGCAAATECLSHECVDGVCCETACVGPCLACAADKTGAANGLCAPTTAGTDPDDECEAEPDPSAPCGADGLCDGTGQCRAHAPTTVRCAEATCQDDVAYGESHCDGAGECLAPAAVDCAPYACAGTDCGSSCVGNDDCASGHRCDSSGHCGSSPECDGDHTVTLPDGTSTDCSPFRCTAEGSCLGACTSSADCRQGFLCTEAGACERPSSDALREDDAGSCGCRLATRRARAPTAYSSALLVLVAAWRRRASPRNAAPARQDVR